MDADVVFLWLVLTDSLKNLGWMRAKKKETSQQPEFQRTSVVTLGFKLNLKSPESVNFQSFAPASVANNLDVDRQTGISFLNREKKCARPSMTERMTRCRRSYERTDFVVSGVKGLFTICGGITS
jgi:hypothetical protein